jgi:hypothetical protein
VKGFGGGVGDSGYLVDFADRHVCALGWRWRHFVVVGRTGGWGGVGYEALCGRYGVRGFGGLDLSVGAADGRWIKGNQRRINPHAGAMRWR